MKMNIPPKTIEEAKFYINMALGFALLGLIAEVGVTVATIIIAQNGGVAPVNPILLVIESLIYAALVFGLYKKSRVAAVLLFCFLTFSGFTAGFSPIRTSFILLLLLGVMGTFYLHKLSRSTTPHR